jgi:hypothetical protein
MKTETLPPTPRTDALWREYWASFPTPENTTSARERIFFGVKLMEMEREIIELKRCASAMPNENDCP